MPSIPRRRTNDRVGFCITLIIGAVLTAIFALAVFSFGASEAFAQTVTSNQGDEVAAASESVQQASDNARESAGCGTVDFGCHMGWLVKIVIAAIVYLAGALLALSGLLLDFSIQETVIRFAELGNLPAIDLIWAVFRDIANIGLVFVLLAIAIGTIIGASSYNARSLLAKVIIVALLLNFSLFFGRLVIDVGNRFAVEFYDAIQVTQGNEFAQEGSISGGFLNALGITSAFNLTSIDEQLEIVRPSGIAHMASYGIGMAAMLFVAAGAFFAGAFLLIGRAVVLILLLGAAALAFVAFILPGTSGLGKRWFDMLIKHTLIAPIMLGLFWVALTVTSALRYGDGNSTLAQAFSKDVLESGVIGVFFNFVLVAMLLYTAIILSRGFSHKGALAISKGLSKYPGRIIGGATFGGVGFLGRETIGRGANALNKSAVGRTLRDVGSRSTLFTLGMNKAARGLEAGLQKTSEASFDARGPLSPAAGNIDVDLGAPQTGGFVGAEKRELDRRAGLAERVAKERAEKDEAEQKPEAEAQIKEKEGQRDLAEQQLETQQATLRTLRAATLDRRDNVEKARVNMQTAGSDVERAQARADLRNAQAALEKARKEERKVLDQVESTRQTIESTKKEIEEIKTENSASTINQKNLKKRAEALEPETRLGRFVRPQDAAVAGKLRDIAKKEEKKNKNPEASSLMDAIDKLEEKNSSNDNK